MAVNIDEVIEEPMLSASCCAFYTNTSEKIKYYYKLKHPDLYHLSPRTILELLDDKQVYSELEVSVESFINHKKKVNIEEDLYSLDSDINGNEAIPIYGNTLSANMGEACHFGKPTGASEIASDFMGYDSVHSIKVPLRTYVKKSRRTPYYQNRPHLVNKTQTSVVHDRREMLGLVNRPRLANNTQTSVAEVTQQMNGLVFERVEKSVSLPLECKALSSVNHLNSTNTSSTYPSHISRLGPQVMSTREVIEIEDERTAEETMTFSPANTTLSSFHLSSAGRSTAAATSPASPSRCFELSQGTSPFRGFESPKYKTPHETFCNSRRAPRFCTSRRSTIKGRVQRPKFKLPAGVITRVKAAADLQNKICRVTGGRRPQPAPELQESLRDELNEMYKLLLGMRERQPERGRPRRTPRRRLFRK